MPILLLKKIKLILIQEKKIVSDSWIGILLIEKQIQVSPSIQMKGKVNINDDIELEKRLILWVQKL